MTGIGKGKMIRNDTEVELGYLVIEGLMVIMEE